MISKHEEINLILTIPIRDLAHDGERRIVDDDAIRGVFVVLIIPSGIERSDYLAIPAYAVFFQNPILNRLIHFRRGETVIGRRFGLELIHECIIIVILLPDPCG